MGLLEFPDEILLKTLAASGCRTVCMAATTCRRLRDMKTTLGGYPVFSSAMAQNAALDKAVADVCNRALTGMLGAVDFAFVFVFESRVSPKTEAPHVVQLLKSKLPQGVVILGSSAAGLMGIASNGSAYDLDPYLHEMHAVNHVALMLGRLPGSSIRTFATEQHPSEGGHMDGLLTLAQEGLQAQLVILLATQLEGLTGSQDLLAKLQPDNQGNGGMVVAGGIAASKGGFLSSGNGCLFFSSPHHALAEPRVAALAICTPGQRAGEPAAPLPPASPTQSGISAAALTLEGLEPMERTPWSNFTAKAVGARKVTLRGPDTLDMYEEAYDDRTGYSLALWRVPNGTAAEASCVEAAASGQPLVLLNGHGLDLRGDDRLTGEVDACERHSLQQVLAPQPGTSLVAQVVDYSSEGTLRVMHSELPKMRDIMTLSHPVTGGLPRTGHLAWEGYEAVRRSAREAGARSGSSALILFSDTGRAQELHGAAGVELELLDQVIGGELPLVGMYNDSQLGPHLRAGYAGWSVASSTVTSQSDASADPGTAAVRNPNTSTLSSQSHSTTADLDIVRSAAARDPTTSTLSGQSNRATAAKVAAAAACATGGGMPVVAADDTASDCMGSRNITVSLVQDASFFQSFTSVFVALGAC